jgi:tripartite-type tricarboxylate transporter receptor subunit TctC
MNKISARTLAATATLALAAAAGTAAAQSDYPNKPIKLIAPYAPGGSVDVLARTLATHLSTELRQSVVVENRPGANTMIAASAVARSPADGYTLLLASNASMVLNPLLYKKLSYNPDKELKLTNILAEAPLVLVTNSQTGIKSVADLKAYSKARPGQLNYSSVGLGNPLQLTTELIKSRLDVAGTSLPHIKAGKLVAIATTGPERSQFLPQTPTIAESGVPGFRASTWFGIAVPAGTPAQARNALQAAVNKVLLNPEFASALGSQTLAARKPQTQAQLDEFLAADSQMWRKVIADNGIALEN